MNLDWKLFIGALIGVLLLSLTLVSSAAAQEEDVIEEPAKATNPDKEMIEIHKKLEHRKPRHLLHLLESDDEYLCEVYKTGVGRLAWKDEAAAKRQNMGVCDYVIGGVDPELKKGMAVVGRKADELSIPWKISSAFRDDYRQSIATGLKARTGYSRHGNSKVTKGYGYGQAIDVNGSPKTFFSFLDGMGRELGIGRPHSFDPGHVQLGLFPFSTARTTTAKIRTASTPTSAKVRVAHVKSKVVKTRYAKSRVTKTRYAKSMKHRTHIAHAKPRYDGSFQNAVSSRTQTRHDAHTAQARAPTH